MRTQPYHHSCPLRLISFSYQSTITRILASHEQKMFTYLHVLRVVLFVSFFPTNYPPTTKPTHRLSPTTNYQVPFTFLGANSAIEQITNNKATLHRMGLGIGIQIRIRNGNEYGSGGIRQKSDALAQNVMINE